MIAAENLRRHAHAYPEDAAAARTSACATGGEYQWRRDGSPHLFNPDTVFRLQHSTRTRRYDIFREYTRLVDEQAEELMTLRGLFELRDGHAPAGADRRGRIGRVDREAVLDRRDELRLDQRRRRTRRSRSR